MRGQEQGPLEKELRKAHLAEFIRDFGEPITEEQALCQKGLRASFDAFVLRQPSKVVWSVIWERWRFWFKGRLRPAWMIVRRIGYWLRWRQRAIGLMIWGVDAKQTDDCLGCVLPNGRYVGYGRPYYRLYFAGRIRNP